MTRIDGGELTHVNGGYRTVTEYDNQRKVQEHGGGLEWGTKYLFAPFMAGSGAVFGFADLVLGKGMLASELIDRPVNGLVARGIGGAFGALCVGMGVGAFLLANREQGLGNDIPTGFFGNIGRGDTWYEYHPDGAPQLGQLLADYDHNGNNKIELKQPELSNDDERVTKQNSRYPDAWRTSNLPLFREIDSNKDDAVDRSELEAWSKTFDANSDGWLDKDELGKVDARIKETGRHGTYRDMVNY